MNPAARTPVRGPQDVSSLPPRRAGNSARDMIGWWEARRIPFYLIVGSASILTCIIVGIVGLASEMLSRRELGLADPPLFALIDIIIYGILGMTENSESRRAPACGSLAGLKTGPYIGTEELSDFLRRITLSR